MNIKWYYYSDTNSSERDIVSILEKKQYELMSVSRIEDLHQHFIQNQHAVLFIKANTIYNVYDLCQEISILYPHVYIILIVPDNMENMRRAMQVGASGIVCSSYEEEEMREVVVQAEKYMQHRASKENTYSMNPIKKNSRVISICSTKGALGRTTMTINLAAAFVKQGYTVAVVDANLQFGDVAMYYDIKPKNTIYEWVKEGYGRSHYSIDQYMVKHNCGVSILAAPPRPEFFEAITGEHMKDAIEELKKLFDIIVIDVPSYFSDIHVNCLEKSDDILLLTISDLPTLRNSKLYIDTLQSLYVDREIKLILNRETKKMVLEPKRIEEILGMPIYMTVPNQYQVVSAAISEGVPFVLSQEKTPVAKAICQLVERLYMKEENVQPQKEEKKKRFLFL